jgi:hypothetical protein
LNPDKSRSEHPAGLVFHLHGEVRVRKQFWSLAGKDPIPNQKEHHLGRE